MLLLLISSGGSGPATGPGTGSNYGLLLALVSEGGFVPAPEGNFRLFGQPLLA